MENSEDVLRDIYMSDVILMDKEIEMMYSVDDSYFDCMEELHSRIENHQLQMSDNEFKELENKFNDFYFEYGFVQFKRGLELGLSLRHIH